MIRFMQWLHRWVSLVLVIQVALWLVSGLFFSLTGHHGMSGHQYMVSKNSEPPLKKIAPQIDVTEMHQRFPLAHSIELVSVAGVGQYQVSLCQMDVCFTSTQIPVNGGLRTKLWRLS